MTNKAKRCLDEDNKKNVWYSIASDIHFGPNAILIRIHSNNDDVDSNEVLFHQISPMLAYFNRKKKSNKSVPLDEGCQASPE